MENVPETSSRSDESLKERFLNHTSQFGFEYFMALVSVLVTAAFISYALFAVTNYFFGFDSAYSSRFFGEASLWIAAAMIVWLPVTLFFYLRSQGEIDRTPSIRTRGLTKFLTAVLLFFSITATIGFAFVAVFMTLRMVIGIEDVDSLGEGLVRVVLPALLSAVLFGAISLNWLRAQLVSRRLFALIFSGIAIVLTLVILVLSVISIRGYAQDQKIENALSRVSMDIEQYYGEFEKLPATLNDLKGIDQKTRNQLRNIEYKAETAGRYQLCAIFITDTNNSEMASYPSRDGYQQYQNVNQHETGRHCFKYIADPYTYDSYPYEDKNPYTPDTMLDSQMN